MFKIIYKFSDKLEDHVRELLSHYPITYAFIAGIGIILFWRGVWHSIDTLMLALTTSTDFSATSIDWLATSWWDGPLSAISGIIILLSTGLFVSNFIGNEILISGVRGDKKISEKTEKEVRGEKSELDEIQRELHTLTLTVARLERKLLPPSNVRTKEKKKSTG